MQFVSADTKELSRQGNRNDADPTPPPAYILSTFFPVEQNFSIILWQKHVSRYGLLALGLSVVLMWWRGEGRGNG